MKREYMRLNPPRPLPGRGPFLPPPHTGRAEDVPAVVTGLVTCRAGAGQAGAGCGPRPEWAGVHGCAFPGCAVVVVEMPTTLPGPRSSRPDRKAAV